MTGFLAELRRRHMFRIGAVYVVTAWAIAQVVDLLSQTFELPDWIAQPLLVVLAIGLPITLIASWVIVGAAKSGDSAAEMRKATTTDWVLASSLIAVLVFMGYQQFASRTSEVVGATISGNTSVAEGNETVEEASDRLPNSVAVLPFENISPNPEDAYFAVGVHDELLSRLSKLQNLSVIARASVLKYRDSAMSIREIAEELNVEMIMAGSVRYAGNQVRVTAELIDGITNLPVWTDAYDGNLSDIFGIQADIAMNIASSLQAAYSATERENIERAPTESPEAYSLYLRAGDIIRNASRGDNGARMLAQNLLNEAIALDPRFASAYEAKARIYRLARIFEPVSEENWVDFSFETDRLTLENLEVALALDPSLGSARGSLSELHYDNRRWGLARSEAEEALRISPNDSAVLDALANLEARIYGNFDQAISYARQGAELDPNSSERFVTLGDILQLAKRYDEAIESYRECALLAPARVSCVRSLPVAELALGNREAAIDAERLVEQIAALDSPNTTAWLAYGYGLLGQAEDAQRAFDAMEEVSLIEHVDPILWAMTYMGVGDYEEALNRLDAAVKNPEKIRRVDYGTFLSANYWNDPTLEQPEWLEMRDRIAFRE